MSKSQEELDEIVKKLKKVQDTKVNIYVNGAKTSILDNDVNGFSDSVSLAFLTARANNLRLTIAVGERKIKVR